jgi:cytosine/adenosine deaminase-related metal-dependent hydrolase
MLLCNLHIVGKEGLYDIRLNNGKINAVTKNKNHLVSKTGEQQIDFINAIIFPGLVNSHDHLDFNLFPQTGNRIYNNYTEWGKDIHEQNKERINAVLKIPQHLRTQWGLYKNLLNGVTTVINHGEKLNTSDDIITVIQNNYCLHSIQFEKKWKLKLNRLFAKKQPFVIHVGEGTDKASHTEIDKLIKWNLFRRKIIGVHGVAMDEEQASSFKALVWCPVSNYFLLNATAAIDELKIKTSILFGTDSTLTASWNLWEHLRLARNTLLMTDEELFDALTQTAARVWKQENVACIDVNNQADIIVANANGKTGFDAFYSVNPEDIQLILHKGKILLFDEVMENQLKAIDLSITTFSKIGINGKVKYVYGDMLQLMKGILLHYPEAAFPIRVL